MTNETKQTTTKIRSRLRRWRGWTASLLMLAAVHAGAAVTVSQSPLVIQTPLAPNIVLMLDDSGSMDWSVMPDFNYLSSTNLNLGLRNPAVNGVYYNPAVTYTPAQKANGTSYPTSSFPNAYTNPFTSTSTTDLTKDTGSTGSGSFAFGDTISVTTGTGQNKVTTTYYAFAFTVGSTVYHVSSNCSAGFTNCYAPTDTSGTAAPAGVAAGTNIANWYSYYSTRLLMAKTGLTLAFANLDPTYRFGFGSINGNNTPGIPSPTYGFSTSTKSSNLLAAVEPFGNGASGTQKAKFWSWIAGESASGTTPLRQALVAAGKYYSSDHPWYTDPAASSSDTTQLACRQSYTILTTDGFWNENYTGVGNADGNNGPAITGPNGQSYSYTAAAPFKDSYSDTLADVAMYYWNHDLKTSIANQVPPSTEDPAFWQHMTTFTVGMGWDPVNISPAGTTMSQIYNWAKGCNTSNIPTNFGWPQPSANNINNIADLAHAAVNGHGGFYSVKNPKDFVDGISDALKSISSRSGSGASLAANSTKLETGAMTYQATYNTGVWTGDLKAYAIDPTTGAIANTASWTADSVLPAPASRNIYTYNGSGMIAFTAPGTLSAAQQAALGTNTTAQQALINYLRGDTSNEQSSGGSYRNRPSPYASATATCSTNANLTTAPLGDIVSSQPVYVGAPNPNLFSGNTFTGASAYPAFASSTTVAGRTPVLYVSANDGMLHGFNAKTGVETFAYLPGAVITQGLASIANPSYGANNAVPHQFFNDGELTVADIYTSGGWKTVLVGSTGRGPAKAVYALDVTDPSSPSLIWERSAGDGQTNSGNIGQAIGKPVVALLPSGQWKVLFGNGYNSTNNSAALLEFALTTASGAFDTAGTLSVIAAGASTDNGLSAVTTWISNPVNGASTQAYAGDLLGNVWAFDLTANTGGVLFTAKDSGGNTQPISAGLLAGKDPGTNNVWLFFGTGKWLNSSDLSNTSPQTWYGIIAQAGAGQPGNLVTNLSSNLSSGCTASANAGTSRCHLVQRSIAAEQSGSPAFRVFTPAPSSNDMVGKSGWYIDLVSPVNGNEGERMVTPNQFQGSLLLGTSRIPQASDACNPTGRGWIMAIDPFSGTNPGSNFFDVNGDGQSTSADMITVNGVAYAVAGLGFSSLPNNPIFVGDDMLVSFDNGTTTNRRTFSSGGASARVSWREIINQ